MALSAGLGGGGSGRRRRGKARRGALTEINMTPLIDVMLVLLIIFMVSATIMNAGIEVQLPKTEAAAMQASDEPLTVTVAKDGVIYIQDRPAQYSEIAPRLKAMTGGRTDRPIFLRGDGETPYAAVAQVMAKLSTAGFTQINLITDTGPPPADRGAAPSTPVQVTE